MLCNESSKDTMLPPDNQQTMLGCALILIHQGVSVISQDKNKQIASLFIKSNLENRKTIYDLHITLRSIVAVTGGPTLLSAVQM